MWLCSIRAGIGRAMPIWPAQTSQLASRWTAARGLEMGEAGNADGRHVHVELITEIRSIALCISINYTILKF